MKKARKLLIVVMCLALLNFLTSCGGNQIVLHPIKTIDIVRCKAGVEFTPPQDGYFLSDEYVKTVMQAKVR